ncbi:hypothetical protein J6O48_09630 [bacterium]|nr:hypothetical protein [bacterium]
MKVKLTVKESLTEYFETIQANMEENKDKQLRIMAKELVGEYDDPDDGYIAPLMSTKFNPNLFLSGQDEDNWRVSHEASQLMGGHQASIIEIMYTGLKLYDIYGIDEAKVWWEFAKDQEPDPEERVLERDYAFFQETGIDPIAKPKYAKHKGAIATGVRASKDRMFEMTQQFVMNILKEGSGYFFMPK